MIILYPAVTKSESELGTVLAKLQPSRTCPATGRLGKTQFEIFSADFIVDNSGGPTMSSHVIFKFIKHLMMSPVIIKKY
jgi:hypothetical protein